MSELGGISTVLSPVSNFNSFIQIIHDCEWTRPSLYNCTLYLLGTGSGGSLRRWSQVRWIITFSLFFNFILFPMHSRGLLTCSHLCTILFMLQLAGSQAKLAWIVIFWMTHRLCMNRYSIFQMALGRVCVCVHVCLKKTHPKTWSWAVTENKMIHSRGKTN